MILLSRHSARGRRWALILTVVSLLLMAVGMLLLRQTSSAERRGSQGPDPYGSRFQPEPLRELWAAGRQVAERGVQRKAAFLSALHPELGRMYITQVRALIHGRQ